MTDQHSPQERRRQQELDDLNNQRTQNQDNRDQRDRDQRKSERDNPQNAVDELRRKVTLDTDPKSGAAALINGMLDKIDAAKGDDEKLAKVLASFRENADGLAHAVVAGTPRDPGTDAPQRSAQEAGEGRQPQSPRR